jgi:hypothetical protein
LHYGFNRHANDLSTKRVRVNIFKPLLKKLAADQSHDKWPSMRKQLFFILFCVFGSAGCSSFKSVSTSQLEEFGLVGHWESAEGYVNIYCNGTVSSKLPGDELLQGDPHFRDTPSGTSSALRITEITPKGLKLSSFWPTSQNMFYVQKWPHKNEAGWQMKLEGILWTKTTPENCR